jgi:hypothetical protein
VTEDHPLYKAVYDALRQWRDPSSVSALSDLQLAQQLARAGYSPRESVQQLLLRLLEQLAVHNAEQAAVLRLRFVDDLSSYQVARQLDISEATLYRRQADAVDQLARLLAAEEEVAVQKHQQRFLSRLEAPSYQTLFGVNRQIDHLLELLAKDNTPQIILLQGIGGIGKTALADALLRRAFDADSFADFAWVTAKRDYLQLDGTITSIPRAALTAEALIEGLARQLLGDALPAPFSFEQVTALLQKRLQTQPHLLVVDNLETVEDLHSLLPTLHQVVGRSKFLLTSRQDLRADAFIYPYHLRPLIAADALALIRHEAAARNLPDLAGADDAALTPIVETVGGNPLALRLVVGQLHSYTLDTVLKDLRQARSDSAEQLFHFIYRSAWDALDEDARQLFLCMPLVAEDGADLEFIEAVSGLDTPSLRRSLTTLIQRNLVDHRRKGLHESTYTIHSLTRTFLLKQVVLWQE